MEIRDTLVSVSIGMVTGAIVGIVGVALDRHTFKKRQAVVHHIDAVVKSWIKKCDSTFFSPDNREEKLEELIREITPLLKQLPAKLRRECSVEALGIANAYANRRLGIVQIRFK